MLKIFTHFTRLPIIWIMLTVMPVSSGLAEQSSNEEIAGSNIPIPAEMSNSAHQDMELMVAGFRGARVAFEGPVEPQEVIRFYQKNMPLEGWRPYASLVTGGGMLVFTKSNQSALIMVSESNGTTTLAILVGVLPPDR